MLPIFRSRENKAFLLHVGSDNILVYCVLEDPGLGQCGGGGWTLAMKIDGSKVFIVVISFFVCLFVSLVYLSLFFRYSCHKSFAFKNKFDIYWGITNYHILASTSGAADNLACAQL